MNKVSEDTLLSVDHLFWIIQRATAQQTELKPWHHFPGKKTPKQTSFWEEQKSEGTASIQFSSVQFKYFIAPQREIRLAARQQEE